MRSTTTLVALTEAATEHPRLEPELGDGFTADQRDDPVWAGLDLDLRHDGVGA